MNIPQLDSGSGSNGWTPGIKYLLMLLIAEIFLFALARGVLNHGG